MKKFLFTATLTLLGCSLLAAGTIPQKAFDSANSELLKTREELQKFAESRPAEIAKLAEELESVRAENAELSSALKALSEENDALGALSTDLKFYAGISSEIFRNSLSFRKSFLGESDGVKWNTDMQDSTQFALDTFDKSMERTFEPLKPYAGEATSGSGEKISGKIFRLGETRYFVSGKICGILSEKNMLYGENLSERIRAFYEGNSDLLPISKGEAISGAKDLTIYEQIESGGIWMFPILAFGLAALIVFIVKAIRLLLIKRVDAKILTPVFSSLEIGDEKSAEKIARTAGYPYADLLLGLIRSRNKGCASLEEISYEYMLGAGEKLFYGMGVLSVTSAVAPLLGLLGTVTGIIRTFADISSKTSASDANFISGGISEALITTEYGLIVAIPAFVAHAILSRRARAVLGDMERLSSTFLGKVSK